MNISQLKSTNEFVDINGVKARVWEGVDENGIDVVLLVSRIGIRDDQNDDENIEKFQSSMNRHKVPEEETQRTFPKRLNTNN